LNGIQAISTLTATAVVKLIIYSEAGEQEIARNVAKFGHENQSEVTPTTGPLDGNCCQENHMISDVHTTGACSLFVHNDC
jgi:hypothetical protein